MSCNGCRILRKGCSLDCTLRPCLQWIKSPDSQANATLFLAKFYGRAGLLNLINAGPADLRHEIFRSLLYEACGRIINPVYGSVGLLGSGNWHRCQVAVDSVLQGRPIAAPPDSADAFHGCDIRHLTKDAAIRIRSQSQNENRTRLTRHHKRRRVDSTGTDRVDTDSEMKFTITGWNYGGEDYERAPSHDMGSVETVEPDFMNRDEPQVCAKPEMVCEIGLDLTLGPSPPWQANGCTFIEISDSES